METIGIFTLENTDHYIRVS